VSISPGTPWPIPGPGYPSLSDRSARRRAPMSVLRFLGIVGMLTGLTIFVVGVFLADRISAIVVSLVGLAIMMAGVAVTNYAQRSDVGPGS